MRNKLKSTISILIIAIILSLLIFYIYKNFTDFIELFSLAKQNYIFIFFIALITLIFLALNGILNNELMKPFGVSLKIREYLGLSIITNFYNYITPFRGGMAVRALYLKKNHKFPIVHFLATLSAVYIIIFTIASFLGILSMSAIYFIYSLFNLPIFLLFLGIFILMIGIMLFSPEIPQCRNKWIGRICKVINGWHLIKNNRKIILTVSFITAIQLILGAVSSILVYSIVGVNIGFFKALFLASIGNLSILIAVTPGNLGIGDAISVFSAAIIGINLTQAVAATIISRAINLLITFILGPIFSYVLLRNTNREKA